MAIHAVGACAERRIWTQFGRLRLYPNLFVFLVGPPGTGKCLAPDEPVIMYDGSIKRSDTLVPGDKLLGPDSTPRTVQTVSPGYGEMFTVTPTKGKAFRCNGEHILSLRKSRAPNAGRIRFATINEWRTWSDWHKSEWKLWRSDEVSFEPKDTPPPVDPYFMGLWLGDGNSYDTSVAITTEDTEVIAHLFSVAATWGLTVTQRLSPDRCTVYGLSGRMGAANPLMNTMRDLGVFTRGGVRSVPLQYKTGSVETRRHLLAGLIDSDGSYDVRGNCYDFISKSEQMSNDVTFLARSLGLAAYITPCRKTCTNNGVVGNYWRVCISGQICDIPCHIPRKKARLRQATKNVLNTGFTVTPAGEGPWFGITIDGDRQFLLEDFTVTHNTVALNPMASILRKSQAVVLAPNDITKQGLLDSLNAAARGALLNGKPFDFHFLALHISELSNFMSQYDSALAGILTDLFDCPDANDEHKRGHDKGKFIPFPGISMIVGTATQNLGNTISEEMWGSGFMARVIMVYSGEEIIPTDMFATAGDNGQLSQELVSGLMRIGTLAGPMEWTPEAKALQNGFRRVQTADAPIHAKLTNYVRRRSLHLGKLCMIAALSEERLTVTADDWHTAYAWMIEAEFYMTEVFKDMIVHEDGVVHEALRSQMFAIFMQTGRKPIHASVIYKWLSSKVASHSVQRVLEVAVAADYLRRVAGTMGDDALYIPQPLRGNPGVI